MTALDRGALRAVAFIVGYTVFWLVVGILLCLFVQRTARAQERTFRGPGALCVADAHHDEGHARYHDFYQRWLRPDTHTSCCNMRIVLPGGGMTGDCRPTRFRLSKGHWQAQLDDGTWIAVPDDRIIREKNPDPTGQDGHLCEAGGMIFCAVPPTGAL